MSDNLMEKVSALGERLRIGGVEVGRKMSEGMSSMSFKMKELFQGPNQAEKIVDEATAETLDEPDWALNLDLCDMINNEKVNTVDLIRGIKKRIMLKNPRVQYLALVLLETVVKNCEKAFSEVAAERLLDEMVKLIDDPQTVVNNRNKALILIEAWGESSDELRYLPVYEETYKIQHDTPIHSFTPEQTKEAFDVARNSIELLTSVLSSSPQQDALKDDLTTTLVQQCHQSQFTVQSIIETAGDNEALLFEALNVNDEIQKVLSNYDELKKPSVVPPEPEPAMIPVAIEPDESPRCAKEDSLIRKPAGSRGGAQGGNNDEMMDDLDEMIFGKKVGGTSEGGHDAKKQQSPKDDLITF
ncbi:TOM1-like protein 1 [Vitis vinifera]|uniref:TOM1-like protein 1 n=1 Tax=Vitis vinifera TaxID=29760 RepID=A0A438IYG7_VITVI|nr:TOM1-like protein 1 [Vitis vinifera]